MEQTKKMLCSVLLFFILFNCLLPAVAFADMGPKPRVHIIVENPPEEYYLDLLTKNDARVWEDEASIEASLQNLTISDTVFKAFYSLESEGWYPLHVQQEQFQSYMFAYSDFQGSLQENGTIQHQLSIFGNEKIFRIILVTADGVTKISDEIKTTVIWPTITFDAETGEVKKTSDWFIYFMQFAITCTGTLILEGILLILFRLQSRRNVKLFFAVNILTQIGLSLLVDISMIQKGPLGAMIVMFYVEVVILAAETMIYRSCMDTGSIDRITVYSIIANLVSWIIGTYFLYDLFYFLAKFM